MIKLELDVNLKNCPFCNSEAMLTANGDYFFVICKKCNAQGSPYPRPNGYVDSAGNPWFIDSENYAVEAWNKRTNVEL